MAATPPSAPPSRRCSGQGGASGASRDDMPLIPPSEVLGGFLLIIAARHSDHDGGVSISRREPQRRYRSDDEFIERGHAPGVFDIRGDLASAMLVRVHPVFCRGVLLDEECSIVVGTMDAHHVKAIEVGLQILERWCWSHSTLLRRVRSQMVIIEAPRWSAALPSSLCSGPGARAPRRRVARLGGPPARFS